MAAQKKARKESQAMNRSWVYTLSNYTDEELEALRSLEAKVHWAGREIAPTTGTPHLQGYIRFEKPCRLSWWKNNFKRAHVEARYGSELQAARYAAKDGDMAIQHGEPQEAQRYSTRAEETDVVMAKIRDGASYTQIWEDHGAFCFWHRRHVMDFMQDFRVISAGKDPFDLQMTPNFKG